MGFNSRYSRLIKSSISNYLLMNIYNKVRDIIFKNRYSLTVVNNCRSRICLLISVYTRESI
jgi:hypothetical protein